MMKSSKLEHAKQSVLFLRLSVSAHDSEFPELHQAKVVKKNSVKYLREKAWQSVPEML